MKTPLPAVKQRQSNHFSNHSRLPPFTNHPGAPTAQAPIVHALQAAALRKTGGPLCACRRSINYSNDGDYTAEFLLLLLELSFLRKNDIIYSLGGRGKVKRKYEECNAAPAAAVG